VWEFALVKWRINQDSNPWSAARTLNSYQGARSPENSPGPRILTKLLESEVVHFSAERNFRDFPPLRTTS